MNADIYKTAWNALGKHAYTFEITSPLLLLNSIFKNGTLTFHPVWTVFHLYHQAAVKRKEPNDATCVTNSLSHFALQWLEHITLM